MVPSESTNSEADKLDQLQSLLVNLRLPSLDPKLSALNRFEGYNITTDLLEMYGSAACVLNKDLEAVFAKEGCRADSPCPFILSEGGLALQCVVDVIQQVLSLNNSSNRDIAVKWLDDFLNVANYYYKTVCQ